VPIKENKEKLKNLSQHPGVYQMLDKNQQVIYIGKAKKP
jgi:Excinuclease ABC subunit C